MQINKAHLFGMFLLLVMMPLGCDRSADSTVPDGGSVTTGGNNGNYGNPNTDTDFDSIMGAHQVYLAPQGADSGDCSTQQAPCRTFSYAISHMASGDGLILLDGDYSIAVNGELRTALASGNPVPNPGASAQLPTGVDAGHPTIVRALNPGAAFIEGGFTLGTRTGKVHHVILYGLTFFTPGSLRNADQCIVKATGIYGGLGVGTADHIMGNLNNLIEDVWIWGKNVRGNAINFIAHGSVWRRVLIRDDGCDEVHCGEGAGNATIAATVYNSHDVVFENVISVDRILRANVYNDPNESETNYADFATAQHTKSQAEGTPDGQLNGRNQWLGCMAVNSEDNALNFEADNVLDGPETTVTIRDFVGLNTRGGSSMDGAHRGYTGVSKHDISGMHLRGWEDSSFYRGCTAMFAGDPGCSVHVPMDPVATGAVTMAPYAAGQSSLLPQTRYGTSTALWPWPHELRIHNDICVRGNFAGDGDEFPDTGIRATKDFCDYNGSLTQYLMSF